MNRLSAVAQTRDGQSDRRSATSLALGRTTIWVLALWSGYVVTWGVVSGSGPAIVATWWLAGVCLVETIARRPTRPGTASGAQQTTDPKSDRRLAPKHPGELCPADDA